MTFTLIGGLSRSKADKERNPDDPEGEDGDKDNNDQDAAHTEKKKRREVAVNTLETNLNNINVKKLDLEFAADPLFHKTTASFGIIHFKRNFSQFSPIDNYGARSLLLINLGVQNGCEIIFDSADHVDTGDNAKKHSEKMIDVLPLKEMLGKLCDTIKCDNIGKLEICPKYANFKFTEESKCLDKVELESEDEVGSVISSNFN